MLNTQAETTRKRSEKTAKTASGKTAKKESPPKLVKTRKSTANKVSNSKINVTASAKRTTNTSKIIEKAEKILSITDSILVKKLEVILDECTALIKEEAASTKDGSVSDKPPQLENKVYTNSENDYFARYGTQILSIFNKNGECVYLSQNFDSITGHKSSIMIGDNFLELFSDDYREKFIKNFSKDLYVDGSSQRNINLKMRHSDGNYYWYKFTIYSQNDQYICMIDNIHENIQTQNTLQKAKLEAELALRSRSEFLANMSHELRTPLNAVIGFSQIMEKGIFGEIDNPQYSGYIRHIQESGHDLLAKIEDLLEIANIDAGRVVLDKEEVYVNELIKQAIKKQIHHAENSDISISYVPKGNVLLFVDRIKIQHILGHLITNSIKFNRSGGEVTIEVKRGSNNGISISVHDNGDGMSILKCYDIKEALRQESCWTDNNNQHIGIGLALTREFVSMHGGEVEIVSSAGVGTTVSINLPRECIRMTPSAKNISIKKDAKQKDIRQLEDG
ncbi:MAG: ATP-binding protein [Rickettsiales bacterium]